MVTEGASTPLVASDGSIVRTSWGLRPDLARECKGAHRARQTMVKSRKSLEEALPHFVERTVQAATPPRHLCRGAESARLFCLSGAREKRAALRASGSISIAIVGATDPGDWVVIGRIEREADVRANFLSGADDVSTAQDALSRRVISGEPEAIGAAVSVFVVLGDAVRVSNPLPDVPGHFSDSTNAEAVW